MTLTGWPVYKSNVITRPQTDIDHPELVAGHEHESVARIIDSTIRCIAKSGYEGASTKEIALAAGVSKSLLHYHFGSKEDILIEAVTHMSRRIAAEITERVRTETPSVDRALKAADALFELLISDRERVTFLIEMWATANHNDRLRARLDELNMLQRSLMKDTIISALGPLTDRLAVPVDRVVLLVQSIVSGFAIESRFINDRKVMQEMFEDIKQVLIRGAFALKPD